MKFPTHRLLIATTALALLAGTTAMAQIPQRGDGPRHEHMSQRMADRMAERQSQLKAALKITPEQEPAWTRYVSTQRPPQRGMAFDRSAWSQMTTPQRLDQMQAHKAERDAHMNQRVEATRALYAALNADQQKVFDSQAPMARWGGKGDMGAHRHGKHHGG